MKDATAKLLLAGAAIAAIAFVVKKNGGLAGAAAGAASALVGAVGDAASGAVLGIGDALGVPRTDMTECERAIAEGRTWDASFACPAGNFLSSLVSDRQPDFALDGYTGTYAERPVNAWTVTENAGGAAFVYPRIRRAQ
ncbi:hypothetical protein [Cupriavidus sp. H39]|uniref:hypothetical protein n=1 Tax=Cupriavidus sp. H39 TaxID=3401635 RepID=UPI003D048007